VCLFSVTAPPPLSLFLQLPTYSYIIIMSDSKSSSSGSKSSSNSVTYSGTNAAGNSYKTYSNGSYYYNNNGDSGPKGTYFGSASGAGYYNGSGMSCLNSGSVLRCPAISPSHLVLSPLCLMLLQLCYQDRVSTRIQVVNVLTTTKSSHQSLD
jgi:hypothetical protein